MSDSFSARAGYRDKYIYKATRQVYEEANMDTVSKGS